MQATIDETNRRRAKQIAYNEAHGITPRQIHKSLGNALPMSGSTPAEAARMAGVPLAAEPVANYGARPGETQEQRRERLTREMKAAAKAMDFVLAAQLRDELLAMG